ncbi:MAG: hypothetical protein HOK21_17930 [Rhodospirillaceae bacterium]|jgi:uncharacterized membrane protein YqiK|nr:hypothetical protein [Rhodospirillaceae bacterium]MBT4691003.1 hypothetical protein [Rhodospirillaceae bacterium]MBT5079943.1 hypothetical protein [Rhodospirillaceae bacterium]MBT5525965.1 hypothetical protein [Rhodospirillaceae bacterium]MBT5879527.1 hypothetical protein [Rhodospirillaceae bacterium]
MFEAGIALFITAIVVIAILYIISIWIYKRAPSNMCFIRTGFRGTKVCLGKGALVLPVFHEVSWVSLETLKLIISRSRDQAILTSDNIRIDAVVELYTHVGHTDDAVLVASRSLGEKTFDSDKVRNLLEAKVVGALRSYAATKTLKELHQNRDAFASEIRNGVTESFTSNGLVLEEVSIVTLEQSGKEFFRTDNVFDAEGLKVITEITSEAKRKVHDTEKRTTVSIRQKDLDTQLELLEIERHEAVARANQDKEIANEQAKQLGEKQIYVLDQRMGVEEKEIDNEKTLERMRTDRDLTVTEEAKRREAAEIQKELALEKERRDREIELIAKAREEELANISRNLTLEKAERDRQIELVGKAKESELAEIDRTLVREQAEKQREIELSQKERERQQSEIARITAVMSDEETARNARHQAADDASLAVRKRALETRLEMLELDRQESFATAKQEQEVANEKAKVLSEQQRFILDRRWEVEQEEIRKAEAFEKAEIEKEAAVIRQGGATHAAQIARSLARQKAERDSEIELIGKTEELERAEIRRTLAREQEERDREIALVEKAKELETVEVEKNLVIELEHRRRDIALIEKDKEREAADIQRFQARETEERNREIAMVGKTKELEAAEVQRLATTAEREGAQHRVESVRLVADAERAKEIEQIDAEMLAEIRRIDEESKAAITRMHMITQSEARKLSAEQESDATMIRARASSEAQKISAEGTEREAAAVGRAEMEVEGLRVANTQRMLEAEATGMEAKAEALKKYNEAATFLELAKLSIEADRDVHIDQARAMGNALEGAQIRMYGGGDGTVDTIRGLFSQGFGVGEVLEGFAQSMPEGLRQKFNANGLRGLFGRPYGQGGLREAAEHLAALVERTLTSKKAREANFPDALEKLVEAAGDDETLTQTLTLMKELNSRGGFEEVPFESVWNIIQAMAKTAD